MQIYQNLWSCDSIWIYQIEKWRTSLLKTFSLRCPNLVYSIYRYGILKSEWKNEALQKCSLFKYSQLGATYQIEEVSVNKSRIVECKQYEKNPHIENTLKVIDIVSSCCRFCIQAAVILFTWFLRWSSHKVGDSILSIRKFLMWTSETSRTFCPYTSFYSEPRDPLISWNINVRIRLIVFFFKDIFIWLNYFK